MPSSVVASSAELHKIPTRSNVGASGITPVVAILPIVAIRPTTPLYAAGRRVEPPVCVPKANGICRAPTLAALPALEPPGVRARSQGLRVGAGGSRYANGVVASLPIGIAPAARTADTHQASKGAALLSYEATP